VARVDLSLCGAAMLAVIVDRAMKEGATSMHLYKEVPFSPRRDCMPGQLDSWPHDIVEWIDELQRLQDIGFVERAAGDGQFVYLPTGAGLTFLRGVLHPIGGTLRSVA
jgi:hypothetical protein